MLLSFLPVIPKEAYYRLRSWKNDPHEMLAKGTHIHWASSEETFEHRLVPYTGQPISLCQQSCL